VLHPLRRALHHAGEDARRAPPWAAARRRARPSAAAHILIVLIGLRRSWATTPSTTSRARVARCASSSRRWRSMAWRTLRRTPAPVTAPLTR
jgi:hypothetical protein